MNEQKLFEGVEEAALRAMNTLCALCMRLGASLTCRADGCSRSFHFPCAAGAGCYQEVRSLEIFCPSHLDHSMIFGDNTTPCLICEQTNDVSDMIFCTSCGNHFHNSCLEPPLVLSVTVRVGWQCPECKTCLSCSESKDETKMLVCDVCDKGFHTYCLKPPVTNIPKNGFKCDRCRVCTDCGLRRFSSKGVGNSAGEASDIPNQPPIRWHSNYTLCERCFQGRKRPNACCAVCERAWRCSLGGASATASLRTSPNMGGSSSCCGDVGDDGSASLGGVPHSVGVSFGQSEGSPWGHTSSSIQEVSDTLNAANTIFDDNVTIANSVNDSTSTTPTTEPGKQSLSVTAAGVSSFEPLSGPASSKATAVSPRPNSKEATRSHKSLPASRSHLHKSKSVSSVGDSQLWQNRKRNHMESNQGSKSLSKVSSNLSFSSSLSLPTATKTLSAKRNINSTTTSGGTRARRNKNRKAGACESKTYQEKDDHPSTVVICRTDDLFMLEQDICLACGSIGDPDTLIACAQCGQCFHSYCADVSRISRTMLEKGWRCLDCTICEGCGQTTEENLLLLCDECDISYHTFCLKPPLKEVPKGGWKCSNCVSCTSCGSRSPGVNGDWHANYTRCAPCVSLSICPVCTLPYRDSELLIKCSICSRWSHAGCDQLRTEDELDFVTDLGYNCALCRELGAPRGPGHQQLLDFRAANGNSVPIPSSWKCGERMDSLFAERLSSCSPGIAFGSAGSSAARSDEEQGSPLDPHQFFMDGVVLSETGLNTIRQVMLKGHPKRHLTGGRRASHPCAPSATPALSLLQTDSFICCSLLLSCMSVQIALSNSLLDANSVNDCAPASVFTSIDDEASQQSAADAEVETISTTYAETKSPSVISEEDASHQLPGGEPNSTIDRANTTPASVVSAAKARDPNAKGKSANASSRRQLNLGVGGFRARSTRMYHPKKTQLAAAAAGVMSGGPLSRITQSVDPGIGKKRRPTKHKSNLEESYPDYLMQAFYGGSLLAASDRAKKRRRRLLQQASLRNKPLASALQLSFNSSATPSEGSSATEYGKPVVDSAWSGNFDPRSVQSSKMPSPRSGFTSPSNPPPRQASWAGGATDLNLDSPIPEDFDMDGDDDGFEDDDFEEEEEEELCTLEDPSVSFGIYKPSEASSLGRHDENLFADASTSSSSQKNLLSSAPCVIDVSMEHNRRLPISIDQPPAHRMPVAGSSAHGSARITPEPSFVEETQARSVPIDSLPPPLSSPKTQSCLPTVLETAGQLPENLDEVTDLMLMDDLLNIAAITNEDLAGTTPSSSVLSGQLEEPRSPHISPMQCPTTQSSQRDSVCMMQNIYVTGVSSSSTPTTPQGGATPLPPVPRSKMPPFDRKQTSQRELVSQVSAPVASEYLEHQGKEERLTAPNEFSQLDRVHSEPSVDTAPLGSDRFSPHVMNQQSLGTALYIEDSRIKIANSPDLCQMQRNANPMSRLPVGCQSPTQVSSSALGDSQSQTGIGLLPELSVMDIESQLNEFERNDIYRGSLPASHATPPMQLVDIVASPKSGSDVLCRTQMSSNLSGEAFSSFHQESLPLTPHSYTPGEQSPSMKAKPLSSPHEKTPRGVHASSTHISSIKPLMVMQSVDPEVVLHQECATSQVSMLQQQQQQQQQQQNLDESYIPGTISGAPTPRPQSGQLRHNQRPSSGMIQSGRVCNSQAFMQQQQQQQQQHQLRAAQRPVHVVQSYPTQPQQSQIPIQRQLVVQQQQQSVPATGQQLRQIVQPHQSQTQSVQQFYVGQQHASAQYVQTPTESTPPPPPYPVSHSRPMKWPQQYSPIAGPTSVPQSPHPYQQQQSPTQKMVSSPPNPSALQFMSPQQQQQRIRPHFKDPESSQQQALFQAGQRVTIPAGAYQPAATQMTSPMTTGRVMASPSMSMGPSASSSAAGSPRGRTFQQQHFSYETSPLGGDPSTIRAPSTGVGVDVVGLAPCTEGLANQQLKSMLRQDVSPRMSGVDVLPTSSVPTPSPAPSSSRINYANWEADERRGDMSTIAPILHANILHPHLRSQVLDFPTRAREIHKLWRRLPSDKRCDFVNQARLNRTQLKASQNASNLSSRNAIHSSTGTAGHFTIPSHSSTPAQMGATMTGEGRNTPISPKCTQSPVVLRQSQSYQDLLNQQQQQQPQQPHPIYTVSQDPIVAASPQVLDSLSSTVTAKTPGLSEPPEGDLPSSNLTPLSHHSDGSVAVESGQVFASTVGGLESAQEKPQKAEEQLAVSSPSNPSLSESRTARESVFFPHDTPTDGVLQYPAYSRCAEPLGRNSSSADSLSIACGTPLHPCSYGPPSVTPSQVSSSPSPNGSARHLQNPPCTPKTPQMNRGLPSVSGQSVSYASQPPSPMPSVPSSPSIGQLAPQQPHQQQSVHLGDHTIQGSGCATQQPHLPPPPPPTWPPSCYTSRLPTCQAMYSAAGSSGASSAGSAPDVVTATSTAVYKSGVPSSPVNSVMRSPVAGFVQPSTPAAASPRQASPAAAVAAATATPLSSPGLAMQRPEQALQQQQQQQHPGHLTSPGRPNLQQHQSSTYSSASQPQHLSQSSIISTADVERQRLKEILAEKVHLRQYQYQNIHLIQQQHHQLQQHHLPQIPGYQYQLQHHQQQHQNPQQQHPSTTSFLSPAARTPHMTGTVFFSGNNNPECGYASAAHRSATPGEHYSTSLPPPPLPAHLTTRSPSVSRMEAVQSPLPPSTPQSQGGLTSVSASSPAAPPASPMISLCSPPVLMSGSAPVAQMRGSLSACEQPSPSQPCHPQQQQHADVSGIPMTMQHRRPSEVMQSPSSYCPLSSTASPYQSSSVDSQVQNPIRSPYRQVPLSQTPKTDSNLPSGGLEETGFEPPVIVSRVIGKERRLAPPTPVQMDQEVTAIIGTSSGTPTNSTRENAFLGTSASETYNLQAAEGQRSISDEQSQIHAMVSASPFESELRYQQSDANTSEVPSASSQQLHPTTEPVPQQYFTSVPGRSPVSQPLSSPHTPTRPQRVGSSLEPSTTHLDDVIAHVVSDAVAYANQPGDSGSSMSPRHRQLQPPGSYVSSQVSDSSAPFAISESPAMPVGRSPVLSQDLGEPRVTGHSSGSVTYMQDFSAGAFGYGGGGGNSRANAYVASRFPRRSPIQPQQQHCTSPVIQQVSSQHRSVMYGSAPTMRPSPSPVDSQHSEYVNSPYDHHQQQLQPQNVEMSSGIFGTHSSEVPPNSAVFPPEMPSPSPHPRPSYSSQAAVYNYVPQSPYTSQSGSEGTPSSHVRMTSMNCFEGSPHGSGVQ
ncbi:Lysine Methyltransferase 2D [Sparganum proliferum]